MKNYPIIFLLPKLPGKIPGYKNDCRMVRPCGRPKNSEHVWRTGNTCGHFPRTSHFRPCQTLNAHVPHGAIRTSAQSRQKQNGIYAKRSSLTTWGRFASCIACVTCSGPSKRECTSFAEINRRSLQTHRLKECTDVSWCFSFKEYSPSIKMLLRCAV